MCFSGNLARTLTDITDIGGGLECRILILLVKIFWSTSAWSYLPCANYTAGSSFGTFLYELYSHKSIASLTDTITSFPSSRTLHFREQ